MARTHRGRWRVGLTRYTYTYIYIYVCVCVCVHTCIYITYIRMYTYIYIYYLFVYIIDISRVASRRSTEAAFWRERIEEGGEYIPRSLSH